MVFQFFHVKIWQLHTVNSIGLIFGYSAAPIVLHLPTKCQLPTTFYFFCNIGDRAYPLLIGRKKSFSRFLKQDSDFPENLYSPKPWEYKLYKHATSVSTSEKETAQPCPFPKLHERSECCFDYKNERSEFLFKLSVKCLCSTSIDMYNNILKRHVNLWRAQSKLATVKKSTYVCI